MDDPIYLQAERLVMHRHVERLALDGVRLNAMALKDPMYQPMASAYRIAAQALVELGMAPPTPTTTRAAKTPTGGAGT